MNHSLHDRISVKVKIKQSFILKNVLKLICLHLHSGLSAPFLPQSSICLLDIRLDLYLPQNLVTMVTIKVENKKKLNEVKHKREITWMDLSFQIILLNKVLLCWQVFSWSESKEKSTKLSYLSWNKNIWILSEYFSKCLNSFWIFLLHQK